MTESELEHIWEGKTLLDDKHLKELRAQFLTNLEGSSNGERNIDKLETDINTCATELQRIHLIKKFFKWIPVSSYYFARFQKSGEISRKLRERANGAYKSGNFAQALRGYNLAIMFSKTDEEELGLAYGNRSALFVQIKEANLAQEDIQRALQSKYPENLKDKLHEREKKCRDILLKQRKDRTAIHDIKENGKKFCDEHLLRLKTPHPTVTNAEEFITIDYSKDRGRRLIANRDVAAGTVLAVEEPFVHILVNYFTWDTKHCHFCSKKILAGIPCSRCTFAMYCGEICREKAIKDGHYFEDSHLPYHHCHQTALKDLIALRILLKVGPKTLFNLFQQFNEINTGDSTTHKGHEYFSPNEQMISGYSEKGIYESGSYLPIYHLISHPQGIPLSDIVSNVFRALVLMYLLRDTTDFFTLLSAEYTDVVSQEKYEDFIASLVLRHIENIPFNAISISELQTETRDIVKPANSSELSNFKSFSYATAIFGLLSLANHSCDPNTVIAKKSEFQLTALVALKNINSGDEVFISYKPQFSKQSTKDRRLFLKDRYQFICQCNACLSNWNVDAHLNYIPKFKCKECNTTSPKNSAQCLMCEKLKLGLTLELESHQRQLYDADELLKSGDFLQAINILVNSLQFFSTHFSPVFSLFLVAQDLYKRALVFLLNSYD